MTDPFAACVVQEPAQPSIPIRAVTAESLPDWLPVQPERVRAWVAGTGFAAKPDAHCLVPGADGAPALVLAGTAQTRDLWSLAGLAAHTARLLGRKGGVSGLSAEEMKALAAFHARHDRLNESLLKEAFQRADSPRLAHILFHLQTLLQERNP